MNVNKGNLAPTTTNGNNQQQQTTNNNAVITSGNKTTKFNFVPINDEEEYVKFGTTKRIMKLDGDTKLVSGEAAVVMGKATEMFLHGFILATCEVVDKNATQTNTHHKVQQLAYGDIAKVVASNEEFDFLRDLLVEVPGTMLNEKI
jgi:hypothetical protein